MNLLPTHDQSAVQDMMHKYLTAELPVRRLQTETNRHGSAEADVWTDLAELGWFGLAAPETIGGSGQGLIDALLLSRKAGRFLLSPSVLATSLAAMSDDADIARRCVDGDTPVALGLGTQVFDPDGASHALIGTAIISFHAQEGRVCLDESVALASAQLQDRVASVDDVSAMLSLAAYLVGIAEATRDAAAAYGAEREQFGKPIAAFQSINHLCADMAVAAEAAYAALVFAGLSRAPDTVAAAVHLARKYALSNARHNIQIHGGVGFTADYDAHLYVKRSHVIGQCLAAMIDPVVVLSGATA